MHNLSAKFTPFLIFPEQGTNYFRVRVDSWILVTYELISKFEMFSLCFSSVPLLPGRVLKENVRLYQYIKDRSLVYIVFFEIYLIVYKSSKDINIPFSSTVKTVVDARWSKQK